MTHPILRCSVLWLVVHSNALAQSLDGEPVSLGSSGGARVNVGVRVVQGRTEREYAGQVALTLPLDRFAAPRQVSAATEGTEPVEVVEAPAKPESQAEPAVSRAFPIPFGVFLTLSRDAVKRALLVAGDAESLELLDGLETRARSSALLPELRLRVARSDDQALRLAPTNDDPDRYSLAGGSDLLLEATATWNLDRLVFADEEVQVARLRMERDKARALVVKRVLDELFLFRRALARSLDPATDAEHALQAELEMVEAAAALDVLTDGFFGRRLRELGLLDPASDPAAEGPFGESAAPSRTRPSPSGSMDERAPLR